MSKTSKKINLTTPKINLRSSYDVQNNKSLIKPIGCGASLVWTQCEDATAEAEKILNDIPLSDYYNIKK